MSELVSIIIPTYKTNSSLKKAIDSVLKQTYKNIEIIVIDDNNLNSKGNIKAKLIMNHYKGNNKVKYFEHKTNKNGSAARNTGYKKAKGTYLCFLDDDDIYYKDKIEKQMLFMKKNNYDLCTCFYKFNNKKITFDEDITKSILLLKDSPQTSSIMISKKLYKKLNGFDESYKRHQDYEFFIRATEITKIGILKDFLYERNNNGINNIPDANKMELIKDKFLKQFDKVIEDNNLDKKIVYARNYGYVAYLYLKNKDIKNTFRVIISKGNIYCFNYLIKKIFFGIKKTFINR